MAAQRPAHGLLPAHPNTARFVSNENESWVPGHGRQGKAPSATDAEYTIAIGGPPFETAEPRMHTTTPDGLRRDFVAFLQRRISQLQERDEEKAQTADNVIFYSAMLSVAQDPTSTLSRLSLQDHRGPIESLESYFHDVIWGLCGYFIMLTNAWGTKCSTGNRFSPSDVPHDSHGKTDSDKKAQHIVPRWYGRSCILCGFPSPQGAHIVPVRATQVEEPFSLWKAVGKFWPLTTMVARDELDTRGREEVANILPMCPNSQWLWDAYRFALRPMADPMLPDRRMYLQMLWLQDHKTPAVLDVLSDFRRARVGPHPGIEHGDVYELTTADPANHPLPSVRFLQIQLGVHKLMAGLCAAAASGAIFRGNPPDYDDDDDDDGPLPSSWALPPRMQVALDAAVDAGALDEAAAERWRVALVRHVFRLVDRPYYGSDDNNGSEGESRGCG